MVPMYVKYMGAEAYGLVGFFAMLQAWFQLLDMGLTPTMARETARYNGGATDSKSLRQLLRALEFVFIVVAMIGAVLMILAADLIANNWLNVETLSIDDVRNAIFLMALIVAFRWICGLYRGAINGFERLVWLSGFNILVATARFILIIPFFIYVGSSPIQFFSYQLVIAILELTSLVLFTYKLLPKSSYFHFFSFDLKPLKSVLKFSLSIAFTSSVWVLVTQTDKLILSKLLSLSEYAYFTLAVLVASGVNVISGPISIALLPRLAKLAASGDDVALVQIYRGATQMVAVIAIPATLILGIFPSQVLFAWTGDVNVGSAVAPVLALYAIGNGFLAFGAFPYYLQFANGDLKLHLIGSALFVLLLIPILIWSTKNFGILGCGYAWLIANVLYFLLWVPKVHYKFFRALHLKWVSQDIALIFFPPFLASILFGKYIIWPEGRIQIAATILGIALVLFFLSIAGSTFARGKIMTLLHRRLGRD